MSTSTPPNNEAAAEKLPVLASYTCGEVEGRESCAASIGQSVVGLGSEIIPVQESQSWLDGKIVKVSENGDYEIEGARRHLSPRTAVLFEMLLSDREVSGSRLLTESSIDGKRAFSNRGDLAQTLSALRTHLRKLDYYEPIKRVTPPGQPSVYTVDLTKVRDVVMSQPQKTETTPEPNQKAEEAITSTRPYRTKVYFPEKAPHGLMLPEFVLTDMLPEYRRTRVARIVNLDALNAQSMKIAQSRGLRLNEMVLESRGRIYLNDELFFDRDLVADTINTLLSGYMHEPFSISEARTLYGFGGTLDASMIKTELEAFEQEVRKLAMKKITRVGQYKGQTYVFLLPLQIISHRR